MAQEDASPQEDGTSNEKAHSSLRWLRLVFRLFALALVIVLAAAWLLRKDIAESLIADTFAENGIRASYNIDSIGPERQVLSDIVIGDPARPDLTIDRLELSITPRLGIPAVTALRLVNPRIYGSLRNGDLSFGDLDPLILGEEEGPVEFPDMELFIEDGRGLLNTDFGRVGLKISGGGHLRGGFSAELAAVAEELALGGCVIEAPSLYGELSIDAEQPHFVGPVRLRSLACPDTGVTLAASTAQLDVMAHRTLAEFEGNYALDLGVARLDSVSMQGTAGEGQFVWQGGDLNSLYDLTVSGVQSPAAQFGELALEGRLRLLEDFARIEAEGDLEGRAIALGGDSDRMLAALAEASAGTLAGPLLDKLRSNLARELRGGTFAASFDARRIGELTSVVVPEARLRGSSGATLLALSRAQLAMGGGSLPRFSGNLATGGEGLPQISGRMERIGNGALEMRLAMREYSAGDARMAVPQMTLLQGRDGRMAFEGMVLASGPLPGGSAQGLELPVDGTFGADGSVALWNGCRDIRFDRLALAQLNLTRQSLTLCPPSGRPILRYGPGGLQLAAGATSLDLSGQLAETPIRLRSGPLGFAFPGTLAARDLDITLGPAGNAQRFVVSDLQAVMGGAGIGGPFTGADVMLAAVPLDVIGANGEWNYSDARLTLTDANFVLTDRTQPARFEPLAGERARLTLADNIVTAEALLRHPGSGAAVVRTDITHDLGTGSGHADLIVDGITFTPGFQPTDLSPLALGVVANVEGTVTGGGRIDWNADGITSSGEFSSDSLDFAAAFGPVERAKGTVVFSDLLNLTTAPDQRIQIGGINPGIEVYDGEIGFELINGERLRVTGGSWPFMGGTLTMRPVDINIGVAESRSYVLEIDGLEASQFVERMELGNLAATGTFDGTIPLVFDADGNGQLVDGKLRSRPPGGNVSYVGELTYEDMGFFANYAFRTLRDLQYDQMDINLDGPLTGELVTQVRFTGIGQGPTAERNIASRIIGDLPIELRVNIRAPFYKLITSVRALYDPAAIRDPRDLGLLRDDGVRLRETVDQATVDALDEEAAREAECTLVGGEACATDNEPDIQPQESE